jgi:hypothetical protein
MGPVISNDTTTNADNSFVRVGGSSDSSFVFSLSINVFRGKISRYLLCFFVQLVAPKCSGYVRHDTV